MYAELVQHICLKNKTYKVPSKPYLCTSYLRKDSRRIIGINESSEI